MRPEAQLVGHTHKVRKGWPWLVVAFFLCPCHIPILLAVLGTGMLGGALARNQWLVILAMGVAFVIVLTRGLRGRRNPACAACGEEERAK